jgi:hypothetical protein
MTTSSTDKSSLLDSLRRDIQVAHNHLVTHGFRPGTYEVTVTRDDFMRLLRDAVSQYRMMPMAPTQADMDAHQQLIIHLDGGAELVVRYNADPMSHLSEVELERR